MARLVDTHVGVPTLELFGVVNKYNTIAQAVAPYRTWVLVQYDNPTQDILLRSPLKNPYTGNYNRIILCGILGFAWLNIRWLDRQKAV